MSNTSTRWLVGIGAAVAALVVLALVLGFVARGAKEYPADSPEGTVQRFLQALEKEDGQAAYGYLAPSVQEKCTYEYFRSRISEAQLRGSRVTLDKTRLLDERAEVSVTISGFRGPVGPVPPFNNYEDSFKYTFLLVRVSDGWRISQVSWPIWWCPEPPKPSAKEPPAS